MFLERFREFFLPINILRQTSEYFNDIGYIFSIIFRVTIFDSIFSMIYRYLSLQLFFEISFSRSTKISGFEPVARDIDSSGSGR